MKKIIIIAGVSFFFTKSVLAQSQYSEWTRAYNCFKGLSYKTKNIGFNKYVNKYEWVVQTRNDYDKKVTFNMAWEVGGDKQTIGQFTLKPGAITNAVSYYFSSSAGNIMIYYSEVCFADNPWGCGANGMCFADCDNGTPNIPTNCGGSNSNTKSNNSGSAASNSNNSNSTLQNGSNQRASNTNAPKNYGTKKVPIDAAECAKLFPEGHPSQCIWANCPCPHNGETAGNTNTSGYQNQPQQKQSVALTLLQDQEFVNQTATAIGDLFELVAARKAERKKIKTAEKAEKLKEESLELMFNTKELETYLQYIVNALLLKNGYVFKKIKYYSVDDESRIVRLVFDKMELEVMYMYHKPFNINLGKLQGKADKGSFARNVTVEFGDNSLLNEFQQSETFDLMNKYSKMKDNSNPTNKSLGFDEIDFKNNKEFKIFSEQWPGNAQLVNIDRLMDSLVQLAEGPIDKMRKLTDVLRERGSIYEWGGNGVKQDKQIAIYYYEKAAASGDVISMLNLSSIYRMDTELKNNDKANYWLEQACIYSTPDSYFCKEYEKVTGKKVQRVSKTNLDPNAAIATNNGAKATTNTNTIVLNNHSEWEEVNNPGKRVIIYRSNDSLVTSKAGLLGFTVYKKNAQGIYERFGETSYKIKLAENNTATQEVYTNGATSPDEVYDFKNLSPTLFLSEPVAGNENYSISQITGEWAREYDKDKKLILTQANAGEIQFKFPGFKAVLLKEVSSNRYEYDVDNLTVTAFVINSSKLQVNLKYKAIGMTTIGYYNR